MNCLHFSFHMSTHPLPIPTPWRCDLLRPPFKTKLQGVLLGDSFQGQHLQDLPASLWGHSLPQAALSQWAQWGLAPGYSHTTQWRTPLTGHLCSRNPHWIGQPWSGPSCILRTLLPNIAFSSLFLGIKFSLPSKSFAYATPFPIFSSFTDLTTTIPKKASQY